MFNSLKKLGKYIAAAFNSKFNEKADPKIQLEQALAEAHDQHKRLTEQAANVLANHKQTEIRLNRAMEELEKLNNSASQAVLMADEAAKRGDRAKSVELTRAAESFANRLIATESEVEALKSLHLQSAQAAQVAREQVATNSAALQTKLAERQKLLSQLDQAKMQEQMNSAMASLNASVGTDVPSLEEVRAKIEARYAKAVGMSELQNQPVEAGMLEVSRAQIEIESEMRLSQIREQLGLGPGQPAAELSESSPSSSATAESGTRAGAGSGNGGGDTSGASPTGSQATSTGDEPN